MQVVFIISFAQIFPWILHLPTPHSKLTKRLNDTIGAISTALLVKTRKEKEAGTLGEREERSILGLLSIFVVLSSLATRLRFFS